MWRLLGLFILGLPSAALADATATPHHLATPAIRAAFGQNVFCKAANVTDAPITLTDITIYRTNGSVAATATNVVIPAHGVASLRADFSSHQYYHCEANYSVTKQCATTEFVGNGDGDGGVLLRIDVIQSNNTWSGASGASPIEVPYGDWGTIGGIYHDTPAIRSAFGRDIFCTATNTSDAEIVLEKIKMYRTDGSVAASAYDVAIPPHGVAVLRGDFSTHQEYHCESEREEVTMMYAGGYEVSEVLLRVEVVASNNALSGADN
jgi:hypothetical protein